MTQTTGPQKRKRKLINTELQSKLILTFLTISCITTLFQVVLMNSSLVEVSQHLPRDSRLLLAALPGLLVKNLVITAIFLIPLIFSVGILATFRLAGPLHRFEQYLRDVIDGEAQGPCKIRKNDELQELCHLINVALETTARRGSTQHEGHSTQEQKVTSGPGQGVEHAIAPATEPPSHSHVEAGPTPPPQAA